ncbi:MAG: hypothetical protein AB1778_00380 [Candidatus Bipolaricaulota bacterium]
MRTSALLPLGLAFLGLLCAAPVAIGALSVEVEQAATQADPTNGDAVVFLVTFDEPVFGFAADDVVLSLAATATRVEVLPGGGTAFRLDVTEIIGDGVLCASVPAGVAHAVADGRPNDASTSLDACVTIDRSPPQAPTTSLPENGTATSDLSPKLSWDAPDDATGIKNYRVVIEGPTPRDTYVTKTSYTPTLTEGVYAWRVNCRDRAGNTSVWSETTTFTVDATPPTSLTLLAATPSPGEWSSANAIDLSVLPSEDTLSGLAGYCCACERSPDWTPSAVPNRSEDWAGESFVVPLDGEWWVHACAVDRAGNLGPVFTSGPFGVDRTPPSLTSHILHLPNDPGKPYATLGDVDLAVVDNLDPHPSVACALVRGTQLPFGDTISEVTARDRAGNEAVGAFRVCVVNTEPPRVDIVEPRAGAEFALGEAVTPTWTVASLAPVVSLRTRGLQEQMLDTRVPGRKTFSVSVTDSTGLSSSAQVQYVVRYACRDVEILRVGPDGSEDVLATRPQVSAASAIPPRLRSAEWLRVRCAVDDGLVGPARGAITYSLVRADPDRPLAPILERIGVLADDGVRFTLDLPLIVFRPGEYTLWLGFVDGTSESFAFELFR